MTIGVDEELAGFVSTRVVAHVGRPRDETGGDGVDEDTVQTLIR